MSTPDRKTDPFVLLRTKFQRPQLRDDLVARPRLLDQLFTGPWTGGFSKSETSDKGSEGIYSVEDHTLSQKLYLISAPAGYGKTTVLAQWLDDCPCPNAWLSLDTGDSDSHVFLTYLTDAIQSVYPGACQATSNLLKSHKLPPQDYLVSLLTKELTDLQDGLVIALDDYHHIEGESVPKLTAALLDHLPHHVYLAIASRQDPNLPLMRLRANGELTELRMADLSFTPDETQLFLEQALELELNSELVETLDQRTEGWIVGLRLAALSLRSAKDPARFVKAFKGSSHRYVMEYLVDEVLSQQPAAIQAFLLGTSILERFCASLCDSVLDIQDSRAILRELDRANLFLVSLDMEGRWYRYHQLFQEMLVHRMMVRLPSQEISSLHARAYNWFAANDFIEEGMTHALTGGNLEAAARLVEDNYRQAIDLNQWPRLRRWLRLLPNETIEHRPGLLLAQAWLLHQEFKVAETLPLIERATEILEEPHLYPDLSLEDEEQGFLLAEAHGLRSQVLYFLSAFEHGLEFSDKSLNHISPTFTYGRSGPWFYWGLHSHALGRGEEATSRLQQVIRGEPESSPFTMHLYLSLCYIHRSSASFPQLSQVGRTYLTAAQKANLPESMAFAHYHLGVLHYEWNELEAAGHHFEAAISLRHFAHQLSHFSSLQGLALVLLAQGRPEGLPEILAALDEFAQQTENHLLLAGGRSFAARLSLIEGDIDRADRESLAAYDGPPVEPMLLFEIPALTRARVLVGRGTSKSLLEAASLLDELLAQAKSTHFTWRQIEILALQAMVLAERGYTEEALLCLEQAIILAQPGWLVRTFVDLGSPLDDLLRQLAGRGVAPEYLAHVLAAFDSEMKTSLPEYGSHGTSFEPLTERELEVLALMNQRMTNREIAQRLVISPMTVKRHASNIYEKLGVGNRRQAAERARDLQFLPPPEVTS